MTIGIYCLSFEGTDKVYIGQAINIENRFKRHLRALALEARNKDGKHKNIKLFNTYNKYGIPSIQILEVCLEKDLDANEISWISEFNSLNNGLNICSGGKAGRGVHTGASIYSEDKILFIFKLLLNPKNTYEYISTTVGVPIHIVQGISNSSIHCWLSDKYPEDYLIMKSNQIERNNLSNKLGHLKITSESLGYVYPVVVDTKGKEYTINSIRGFAIEHNLDGGNLIKMLDGKTLSCKGFKLKNALDRPIRPKKVYGSIMSPEGKIYTDITNIKQFSEEHGLCSSSIGKVLRGTRPYYKGWKLAE